DERGQAPGLSPPGSRTSDTNRTRDATPALSGPAESRPVVYRPGHLPPGLPSWFAECDQDNDGQVSLYEWRRHNDRLAEFHRYDLNKDGFVTVEEVLRSAAWESNGRAPVADARQGGPGRGGPGGGAGRGPGKRGR